MKKNIVKYILAGLILSFSFISCGVDPTSITLNSKEELVSVMNSKFEGTFTYKDHEINEKDKYIKVIMDCEVDDKVLEVFISEKHKADLGEFGTYYHSDGTFRTDYYAARYGETAAEKMKSLLVDYFEYIAELPGFRIIANKDNNTTDLIKLKSVDDYVNYIKENGILSYTIVVPFEKEENRDFELMLVALPVDPEFSWINSSTMFIYDPASKVTDEMLKLNKVDLESNLEALNIAYKYK